MRSTLTGVVSSLLLVACGVAAVANAESRLEKILFVEAPPRFVSQCELREATSQKITCLRNGTSFTVALSPKITVWKGQDRRDTAALRRGDRLDIRLAIDAANNREVATFVWANLAKVEGVVGATTGGRTLWVAVYPLVPGTVGVVSPQPHFAFVDDSTSFLAGARKQDLAQGRAVIVIGERWDNRRMHASRIILSRP